MSNRETTVHPAGTIAAAAAMVQVDGLMAADKIPWPPAPSKDPSAINCKACAGHIGRTRAGKVRHEFGDFRRIGDAL